MYRSSVLKTIKFTIQPLSSFGSELLGDTLFVQLCWAIRDRYGNDRLEQLLEGYLQGTPFLVCSDAFPSGYLKMPAFPFYRYEPVESVDPKAIKRMQWLPVEAFERDVKCWLKYAQSQYFSKQKTQPHNSIDRRTGTTGSDEFAPYTEAQTWFTPEMKFDLYLVFDDTKLSETELQDLLTDVGLSGYGRNASVGQGKFSITSKSDWNVNQNVNSNCCYTLSACAPQGMGFEKDNSFYQLFVRFGRHGGQAALSAGGCFKAPLMLAAASSLFSPNTMPSMPFVGQGIGGDDLLSKSIKGTVHQGYAPFLGVYLDKEEIT